MDNRDYKIKFLLAQVGKNIVFAVYEMDERFRATKTDDSDTKYNYHYNSKGLAVESIGYPELMYDSIHLRGANKDRDHNIDIKECSSIESANLYHSKVLASLKDWAENWEGFKESVSESSESSIYTF